MSHDWGCVCALLCRSLPLMDLALLILTLVALGCQRLLLWTSPTMYTSKVSKVLQIFQLSALWHHHCAFKHLLRVAGVPATGSRCGR